MGISSSMKKLCISASALALVAFASPFMSLATAQTPLEYNNDFTSVYEVDDTEMSRIMQQVRAGQEGPERDILVFRAEVFSAAQAGTCVIEITWEHWSEGELIAAVVTTSAEFSCSSDESSSQKNQPEFRACDSVGYDPVTGATSEGPPCSGGGSGRGRGSSITGGGFGNGSGGGFGSSGNGPGFNPNGGGGIFGHLGSGPPGGSDDSDPDDDGESDDGDGAVETFVCDEQEYTLPPGFVALPTPPGNPWYPLMQNPQTGEILHTPWYAEEMEQFRNNYDWGLFLRNLAGIGVASVSGVGAAQFQAWTLPAGSGLAVLEGPLPYPEGWEPPGC